MKTKILDYSVNDIISLTYKASHDKEAFNELLRLSYRVADNANRRMKTFEKNDIYSPTYKKAMSFLNTKGKNRFSKSKKMTITEMREQILNGRKFLISETGTVKGYREYRSDQLKRIEEYTGIKVKNIDMFESFLESELFKQFNEYDSESSIREGLDMVNNGLSLEKMQKEWEKYERRELESILDVWDNLKEEYDI